MQNIDVLVIFTPKRQKRYWIPVTTRHFCYHLRAVTDNLLFFQLLMDHSHDYILV